MHLNEEQIQRLLHGELPPSDEPLVRGHLGVCPECRAKMDQADAEEGWTSQRLRELDHRMPQVNAEQVLAAARPRRWSPVQWAATVALTLAAAGAAYATPGSPLPRLVDRIIGSIRHAPATPAPKAQALDTGSGIAIDPGEQLTIVFRQARRGDTAVVSLTNRSSVEIRARGSAITYSSESDRLSIANQGPPARFEIAIPRSARVVDIRLGGQRIWSKQGSRIGGKTRRDSKGRYLLPLSQVSR